MTPDELKALGIELDEDKTKVLLDKYNEELNTTVTGLKSKNSELIGKEKQLKDALKQYDGLDLEAAKEALRLKQELVDKKLIESGKLDELVNQRTERMKSDYDKKIQELSQQASQAQDFANRFKGRVLSDEIRSAASLLGVIPSAIEDAIYRGRELFTVDDEGKVIPKESAGLDAKGAPLTTKAWLESMKETAPHWFPVPKGGGASGSDGGKAAMSRSKMSSDEKLAFIQQHGQDSYLKLPK